MLKVIILSLVCALICTVFTTGIGFIVHYRYQKYELNCRIGFGIVFFIADFLWMAIYLYQSCQEQTVLTVIRWIFPALLVETVIQAFIYMKDDCFECISTLTLSIISMFFWVTNCFAPVQNLIYMQDKENMDVTYAIASDEILAKIELNIDNSINDRDKYEVKNPEMREINGEYLAVYPIKDIGAETGNGSTEYIPGYAIQKKDELPQIISKRIYFDTSYTNGRDALRTVRRNYPTVVIGDHKFDIDDDWNPYEVFEYRENRFFTTGEDYGLIILNLMDGTCEKYPAAEGKTPSWVDFKTTYPI